MKHVIQTTLLSSLLLSSACGLAAQPRASTIRGTLGSHYAQATKLDTGLVIVPFAVPVAVPVATVRQPSVLYSFRSYASAYQTSPQMTAPAATPAMAKPADAASVLARRCASCHSGAAAQGRLALFDDTGALLSKLPRRRIVEAVESGRMPQPASAVRLTNAEIELLRVWAQPPAELEY
jgi:mono/diheme cytochrome c family protein